MCLHVAVCLFQNCDKYVKEEDAAKKKVESLSSQLEDALGDLSEFRRENEVVKCSYYSPLTIFKLKVKE